METAEEVLENLKLADMFIKKQFPEIERLSLVLIGGASIMLKGFENKMTYDIDTITKLEDDVNNYLQSFAINSDASYVSIMPDDYKNRLTRLGHEFNVLEVYLPSSEDLVISKVGRFDVNDKRDLEETGILDSVDTDLLTDLGDKVSEKDEDFKAKWNEFKGMSLFG